MIAATDHLLSLPEWVALPEDRDPRMPAGWAVVFGVEVVTEPDYPASVRVPDVVHRDDIADDAPHFLAEQGLIAIEVIADGTRLTDTVSKPVEHARAGIPCYRAVYQEAAAVTGMFETNEPFSLRVDVAALARRA